MTDIQSDAVAIDRLVQQAQRAMQEGRAADTIALYQQILGISPENPMALNALGNRALEAGDATAARNLFERAVVADPGAAAILLNLAVACQASGDDLGELAALDRALVADPYFLIALLQKAQWLERHDRQNEAVRAYRGLLDAAPARDTLTAQFREVLDRAQALVSAQDEAMEAAVRTEIGSQPIQSQRFQHCLEILGGRRKVYLQQPAGLHFPYLPAIPFFGRELFPWFSDLEESTGQIRDELLGLTREGVAEVPYVQVAAGQPVNQWKLLNHSLDWGALFIWKDGQPVEATIARCPSTAALMRRLPLFDSPQRGPTVMFSTLRPHTRIPPHHGVTNTRAVVHLPLIVPEDCGFRVGEDVRVWHEGEAWAFDDTIEHEAWNDSNKTRVILIIDVWNPFLDDEEKALLRNASRALHGFGSAGL